MTHVLASEYEAKRLIASFGVSSSAAIRLGRSAPPKKMPDTLRLTDIITAYKRLEP